MGEEWGATQPFCFFTDFHDELADAVRGPAARVQAVPRIRERSRARAHPDPNAWSTFAASRLDWSVPEQSEHRAWLELVRQLLRIRHEMIVPRLGGIRGHAGTAMVLSDSALRVAWTLADGSTLELIANLADRASPVTPADGSRATCCSRTIRTCRQSCAPGVCRRGRSVVAPARVMSAREPIRRLGELYGIESSYIDFFGKRRQVPLATERAPCSRPWALRSSSARHRRQPARGAGATVAAHAGAGARDRGARAARSHLHPAGQSRRGDHRLGAVRGDRRLHEGRLTPDELPRSPPPRWTAPPIVAGAWLCRPTCRAITGCPWRAGMRTHAARCS